MNNRKPAYGSVTFRLSGLAYLREYELLKRAGFVVIKI